MVDDSDCHGPDDIGRCAVAARSFARAHATKQLEEAARGGETENVAVASRANRLAVSTTEALRNRAKVYAAAKIALI